MKRLGNDEIKAIQLQILEVFVAFCEKENLRYSLYFGSLLGAVRHMGYIPWDDDIDVMMPRPDYDKFLQTFKYSSDLYYLRSNILDEDYPYIFAKLAYNKSKLVEFSSLPYDIGINIDIFPIDGVPEKTKPYRRFYRSLKILHSILLVQSVKLNFKDRKFHKNVILIFLKFIVSIFPYQKIIKLIDKRLRKNSFEESKYAMASCFPGVKRHHRLKKAVFEELIYLTFESKKVKSLKHYDEFLKSQYGDYMKIPPENERNTHHSYEAYLV